MSLFQAEIRNRVSMVEDSLTSKAFGVLDLIDKKTVLLPFLRQCGVDIDEDAPEHLRLSLWEWQGNSEPDVIIKGDNLLVYIEAKLGSPLGKDQLIKEYEDGMKKKTDFYLIAITRDALEPEAISAAKQELEKKFDKIKLSWTRWQDLYSLVKRVKGDLPIVAERMLAQELIDLLASQGLKTFDGFDKDVTRMSLKPLQSFFEDLTLFANEIALRSGLKLDRFIRKGPQSSLIDYYKDWFSPWVQFQFWHEKWKKNRSAFIGLYVDLLEDEPEVSIGYELSLESDQEINRGILQGNEKRIAEEVPNIKGLKIYFEREDYDMEDFDPQTFEERLADCQGSVTFYFDIPASSLLSDNILDDVLDKVNQLVNFVNDLELYTAKEENQETGREEKPRKPAETEE